MCSRSQTQISRSVLLENRTLDIQRKSMPSSYHWAGGGPCGGEMSGSRQGGIWAPCLGPSFLVCKWEGCELHYCFSNHSGAQWLYLGMREEEVLARLFTPNSTIAGKMSITLNYGVYWSHEKIFNKRIIVYIYTYIDTYICIYWTIILLKFDTLNIRIMKLAFKRTLNPPVIITLMTITV